MSLIPAWITGVGIRQADDADLGGITRIIRELGWFKSFREETEGDSRERVRKALELCRAEQSHTVYVAEDRRGKIVGYATVHWMPVLFLSGPEAYITELFVQKGLRGHGVGGKLLKTIEVTARNRGCVRMMLNNSRIRESYKRGFYRSRGWQERPEAAVFILELLDR